jgi:transcriptional regulator with XRE-family HTH domain
MNKWWPQQGVFAERVKEFCKRNGLLTKRGAVQMGVVADMFHLNEDVLRKCLQDSTRKRPHLNTLAHIAKLLGCSVLEFLDAPTDPPPTISHARWAEMDEGERAIVISLIAEISADDLTLVEKDELLRSFREAKERILRLREAWRGSASE